MSSTEHLLEQGIAAAKAGQRQEARQHLQAVIRQDPHNEKAWLWMSGVLDVPAQRRECLQRVLTINPSNEMARRGLEQIAQQEAASFFSVFEPHPPASPRPATSAPPPEPASPAASDSIPEAPPPTFEAETPAVGAVESSPLSGTIQPPSTNVQEPLSVPLQVGNVVPPPRGNTAGASGEQEVPSPSATPEVPPPSKVREAPCYFCSAVTGPSGECSSCGMEQIFECPECSHLIDLRERTVCECGQFSMQKYLISGGVNREELGNLYAARDYPGAAVKQWKAALPASSNPSGLHRKIATVYLNLGLIEQARMHNELSKNER